MITLELTNDLLNSLIAITTRIEMEEISNSSPDSNRLNEMQILFAEINRIMLEPGNFDSKQRLEDIWTAYYPIYQMLTTV